MRDAVVAENVEIPGGAVEQGKGQLLLRTLGRIDATEDFNNIVIATKNGTPIRVSDIGYAEDTFERPTSSVWYGDKPAVLLDIRRAMGENTVAVIEGVRGAAAVDSAVAAEVGQADDHPRRLEVHLRLGRVARGAPDLRQPVRGDRRDVLHPQHPRGASSRRWRFRRRSSRRSR